MCIGDEWAASVLFTSETSALSVRAVLGVQRGKGMMIGFGFHVG